MFPLFVIVLRFVYSEKQNRGKRQVSASSCKSERRELTFRAVSLGSKAGLQHHRLQLLLHSSKHCTARSGDWNVPVSHVLASMVLTEAEFSRAHLRTCKWKAVCVKPDPLWTTLQYILLTKNHLLIYPRVAIVICHILGTLGSKPGKKSEARMAGGKNILPTLLLFHIVHAKINQQLWKVSSFQSSSTDHWFYDHPGSMSPHTKIIKVIYNWTYIFPFETSLPP